MLPKQNRLQKQVDFERLRGVERPFSTPFFKVKILPNKRTATRFGIIISSKISKKAVDRNRTKRRLVAALEKRLSVIKPGYDIVIVVGPRAITASSEDLAKTLYFALTTVRLMPKND